MPRFPIPVQRFLPHNLRRAGIEKGVKLKIRLPNFLVIGAARSGTTSFYNYLNQHPEIYMSPVKEPNFFAFDGRKPSFRGPDDEDHRIKGKNKYRFLRAKYAFSITSLKDYCSLFAKVSTQKAIGESSVIYMNFPETADRIKHLIPDARLAALLRHPADRAYSKFLQARRLGVEPIADFVQALEAEPHRMQENWSPTWLYKQRGFYYRQLKPFFDAFDRRQIKIILFEHLRDDPLGTVKEIFRFLGVADTFVPDVSERYNPSEGLSIVPKSWFIENLRLRPSGMKRLFKRILPEKMHGRLKTLVQKCNTKQRLWIRFSPMPVEIRGRLVEEYRSDILKLQEIIGQDLSHWLV